MYLTRDEVERLTGKKRYSAQIRWLTDHGYKFDVNGLNMPVVAIAESNRKLVGGSVAKRQEPNWEVLRGTKAA
jgi:hypothetical protein